jgi:hypothetical protein
MTAYLSGQPVKIGGQTYQLTQAPTLGDLESYLFAQKQFQTPAGQKEWPNWLANIQRGIDGIGTNSPIPYLEQTSAAEQALGANSWLQQSWSQSGNPNVLSSADAAALAQPGRLLQRGRQHGRQR